MIIIVKNYKKEVELMAIFNVQKNAEKSLKKYFKF